MTLTKISTAAIEDNAVTTGKIADGAIVNADINASAAIAGTKVSPDFGSQNITTTGDVTANGGDVTISGTNPILHLVDTNDNPNYRVQNINGVFQIYDATSDVSRLNVATNGLVSIPGGFDVNDTLSVTSTAPHINLVDTNANSDFRLKCDSGNFHIEDTTNAGNRLSIASNGNTTVHTKLGVGTTSNGGKLTVLSTSSTYEGIELQTPSGDSSGEFHIGVHQSGATSGRSLVFKRGGSDGMDTESMRIDPSGRLLIGTTTEGHSNADDLTVNNSGNCGITIRSGSSSDGNIFFSDDTSGNGETRGVVKYKHADDALVFNSNGSERMRLDSAGKVRIGNTGLTATGAADNLIIGSTTGGNGLTIFSAPDNQAFLAFGDTDTTGTGNRMGTIIYDHTSNYMRFSTNGNQERMRIDSSGKVGIGTNSPQRTLHLSSDNTVFALTDTAASTGQKTKYILSDAGAFAFGKLSDDYGTATEQLRIDNSGNSHFGSSGTLNSANTVSIIPAEGRISYGMDGRTSFVTSESGAYIYSGSGVGGTMPAGDLILQSRSNQNRTIRFVTGSTPTQRMSIDSGGLKFGTDTADANGLHDYEEGTWTPTINSSLNANIAVGRYVKVGSLVMASARLDWNSNSGAGGGIGMGGLPFNTVSDTYTRTAGSVGFCIGFDTSGNHQMVIGAVQGTSNIYVQLLNDNGAGFAIGAQNCSSSGEIQLTITYRTDA